MILRGNVFSRQLEMETGITVVSPSDYSKESPYQIAYLLHGLCGNNSDFTDYTMLPCYAQDYHCIFVMPEAGRSFYADMAYGQRFFRYISEELPRICKSVFNISAEPEDTFVIGVSVGGYGAMRCALTYPERYAACGALSPGCLFLRDFLPELKEFGETEEYIQAWGRQFINDFRSAFGENFTWSPDIELLELAKSVRTGKAPRLYTACGTEDGLIELNRAFYAEMKKLPFPYTYEEWSGQHDWDFFNTALKKALDFCLKQ